SRALIGRNMKRARAFTTIGIALGICLSVAWWCGAQVPAKGPVAGDLNPALDRLAALVSCLEANHQTNALRLFNDYANSSIALQHSADMGIMLNVLEAIREGRTTNAIELLEGRLDTDIISFAGSYKELPWTQRRWLGLQSLSEARVYRDKFPRKNPYQNGDEGVAQAFQLLNDSAGR
ncbi:MAG: hypothetical protein ACREIC_12480, partial [Limisphaerales bacterium]